MKVHTTNYENTFLEVSEDSQAFSGMVPPVKDPPTVAQMQFSLIHDHPYQWTSDEVLFEVYFRRSNPQGEREEMRHQFFSRGQPCLRTSALVKVYGWGIHFDGAGRVALYSLGSLEYHQFQASKTLGHIRGMKNKK